MTVYDLYRNIFRLSGFDGTPEDLSKMHYAHCVSADLAMGAGIAVEFDKRYHIKDALNQVWPDRPRIVNWPSCFRVGPVYNIITKERYFHKPTYDSMQAGLIKLRQLIEKDGTEYLAMPKIGCGLDKLKWDKVRPMILNTFSGYPITIYICSNAEE